MGSFRCTVLLAAVVLASAAGSAPAQTTDTSVPPAHLAYVDGAAWIDRETDCDTATNGMPFIAGDRLTTDDARVEILFADGSALDLDQHAVVELQANNLLRLTQGRVVLIVARASVPGNGHYTIDTPVASVESDGPGEYRISVLNGAAGLQTALAVVRGSAALLNDGGLEALRAGQRSVAGDQIAPSQAESFNAARADAFYQWSLSRRDERFATASRDHLPDDLRPYAGDLEHNGNWDYENTYGYVWYPNVESDWQPYSDGYWSPLPVYGWTWIGAAPWAWPTHHYGRWGYGKARWFWIPDRRWSPAWVSWGATAGYVSWCPLGFDNRPVFALNATSGNAWKGWTIAPHDRFVAARHQSVRQFAVKPGLVTERAAFITSTKAPVLPPRVATRQIIGNGPSNRAEWNGRRATPKSGGTPPNPAASRRVTPPQGVDDGRERASRTQTPVDRPADSRTSPPIPQAPGAANDSRDGVRAPRTGDRFHTGTVDRRAEPRGFPPTPPAAQQVPRTALPPAKTALPPVRTALPPAATALPPATTALPLVTTPSYRVPRGTGSGSDPEERKRPESPRYGTRDSQERAAPPARPAPRAEQPSAKQEAAPSGTRTAQPRESRESHGDGKGSAQGTPSRDAGGGSGKGKR